MKSSDHDSRPAPSDMQLSIVLPVYNEAAVLGRLLDSLDSAVRGCVGSYEIIFVNDGSHDDSPALLDQLAAEHPWVRVVHLSRNFGHQAAVQAGLAHARGDAVVLMDSDMQDAPTALPEFIRQWQAGYDVVYAVRVDRKEHFVKRLMFAGFYRLLSSVSSTKLPLDAGNFGLIDRRVARQIVSLGERDRYFAGLRGWVGFRQKGIPVERSSRYDDQPRVSFWGLCRLAKTAVFSFSHFPLAAFYAISLLALAAMAFAWGHAWWTDSVSNLNAAFLVGSGIVALNALGIAVLGEYVARIYDQVRARPLYIVERQVNFDSRRQQRDRQAAYAEAASMIDDAEADALDCLANTYATLSSSAADDEPYLELLGKVSSLLDTAIEARETAPQNETTPDAERV